VAVDERGARPLLDTTRRDTAGNMMAVTGRTTLLLVALSLSGCKTGGSGQADAKETEAAPGADRAETQKPEAEGPEAEGSESDGAPTETAGARGPATGIKPGAQAPGFTVKDDAGNEVRLSAHRGKKAVLLAFYPKDFTPG
jgi:hypothetical protein